MIFNILLVIHIICGTTALISALLAICIKKGAKLHRTSGRFFYYGMLGIFLTALPMSIIHPDLSLFFIALFSFHRAFTGLRFAVVRDQSKRQIDKIICIAMFLISIVMIFLGAFGFGVDNSQQIVLIAFGILSIIVARRELTYYRTENPNPKMRIAMHLSSMLGGTIAVITAFLVVNIQIEHEFIVFILPTVVLVPFIIYWNRKVLA